jgi:hypothetical protein
MIALHNVLNGVYFEPLEYYSYLEEPLPNPLDATKAIDFDRHLERHTLAKNESLIGLKNTTFSSSSG